MSAPLVSIGRLSATAYLEEGPATDSGRFARLLGRVADDRLGRALRHTPLPPGVWCVRHLDVAVSLDLARPDPALETVWAAALAGAIRQALQRGAPEVVRFDHERDALVDLVSGVATGRLGAAWAWRRLGLLEPADPPLDRAPGEALVTVLGRRPRQVLGTVLLAAGRVGPAALQRVLGTAGWRGMAALVREALGAGPAPRGRPASWTRAEAARAAALVDASRLAALLRGSRLHLEPETVHALAVLLVAERDPSALPRPTGEALVGAVAHTLAARLPSHHRPTVDAHPPAGRAAEKPAALADRIPDGPGSGVTADPAQAPPWPATSDPATPAPAALGPPTPWGQVNPTPRGAASGRESVADRGPGARPASAAPGRETAGAGPAATPGGPARSGGAATSGGTEDPGGGVGATLGEGRPRGPATEWAGLLFLLATADSAGVPEVVLDDPALAARPLPWALQGIALQLVPATVRDPAVAAFAAADPEGPPPWLVGPPAGDDELARLTTVGHRWAAVTAAALAETTRDPLEVVVAIARRAGTVDHTPGWLEVHLDLDQVDVAVRRAGLDLDPGWVWWLGTVVRFVYA